MFSYTDATCRNLARLEDGTLTELTTVISSRQDIANLQIRSEYNVEGFTLRTCSTIDRSIPFKRSGWMLIPEEVPLDTEMFIILRQIDEIADVMS